MRGLDAKELSRRCDPDLLGFETTAELDDLREVIGQPRAVAAVRFGVGMEREGYNVYALGPEGMGKHALARRFVEESAASKPAPPDLVYVNNFEEPNRPRLLRLPPGTGLKLRGDMERLSEGLRPSVSAAFESEEYQSRRQLIEEEYRERSEKAFGDLQQKAQRQGLALLRTPVGWVFAPARDGQVLPPEEVQRLPVEERRSLESRVAALQRELQEIFRQMPRWEQERQDRINELNREVTNVAVEHLIRGLRDTYASFPGIVDHMRAVQRDIVENARQLVEPGPEFAGPPGGPDQRSAAGSLLLRRYGVNVLVDNGSSRGAPVVYEDNPTHQNLIGRVEYVPQMGALITDFHLIRAGALHRASGGYLLLDARRVLAQPYAWDGLKRALRSGRVRIESPGQMLGFISTVSLEPEPAPLDVKVVLLGDRLLYYLLCELDPDFKELFKVEADFDDRTERTQENEILYARLIGTLARKEGLRPFDSSAVARVIEHGSRLAGDAERLSTRVREIADVLREADYWAGEEGNGVVAAAEVQRAIDAKTYRSDRLRERIHEEILRDTIFIDTEGRRVGQVNGLSVLELGGFSFGRPSRITARVRLGKGEVVDIEREVELSGPIHSKGVLILSGFLGARYAAERPLSLSASLVFEQSYGGVEGDSASSAELYALLSAISGVPLKQSLAVTGSVNQHGQVQAIGGVNEKIEGFFDVCRARGLTGEQGVLIPASNVKHLMLRSDVVEAVSEGRFHVYPVETVDQGIELLTGTPAGERDEAGNYPAGSINGLVEARLAELTDKQLELSRSARGEDPT